MKVLKFSENDLDERLDLDRRRDRRAFCICFETLEEAPKEFYDFQFETGEGLSQEFWKHFEGENQQVPSKSWKSKMAENFCFNTDMFGSERLVFEINHTILGDKLLGLVLSYLEKNVPAFVF